MIRSKVRVTIIMIIINFLLNVFLSIHYLVKILYINLGPGRWIHGEGTCCTIMRAGVWIPQTHMKARDVCVSL